MRQNEIYTKYQDILKKLLEYHTEFLKLENQVLQCSQEAFHYINMAIMTHDDFDKITDEERHELEQLEEAVIRYGGEYIMLYIKADDYVNKIKKHLEGVENGSN